MLQIKRQIAKNINEGFPMWVVNKFKVGIHKVSTNI